MDFSDYTSYPVVAGDYSPTNETYYLADSYTHSPDHSLAKFCDCESYFDRPLSSVEGPAPGAFPSKNPAIFNTTLPAAVATSAQLNSSYHNSALGSAPFGQLEQFPSGFAFDSTSNAFESSVSPVTDHSRTPSLCGDGPSLYQSPGSPEVLQHPTLKRESTDEGVDVDEEPMPKRPQRKRGRPRLDRSNSDTSSTSSKCQRTSRLPHNQVERKYREGLNAELERLRRAVPTLPQCEEGGVMGQPKPSKAMVLAGAIDYIKKIERERDLYREENDRLRGIAQRNWGDRKDDLVSEFLEDP